MNAQRGFALAEVLLACAVAVAIGLSAVALLGGFGRALAARSTTSRGTVAADTMLAQMRADAAGAFAVFVPANDVFGESNAGAAHEVDFYTKDDAGTEFWWAYRYDAGSQSLRRYDYVPGAAGAALHLGVADRLTGAIDPGESYPPLTGVTAFAARTLQATALTTNANRYGALLASLSAGTAPQSLPVGFVPATGVPRADLFGGNALVEVTLTAAGTARLLHLGAAAASGFTVHARPAFRAIVYRVDVSHRFFGGLGQKTWARIYEQLQYSFTPANPALARASGAGWRVWCDFELYGSGTDGLALNDAHATFRPHEWNETAAGAFYFATQGDLTKLSPSGCARGIPVED